MSYILTFLAGELVEAIIVSFLVAAKDNEKE